MNYSLFVIIPLFSYSLEEFYKLYYFFISLFLYFFISLFLYFFISLFLYFFIYLFINLFIYLFIYYI
ncbi:hypothetical protein H8356DRAFT_515721 [Neocallimastix lanati (nom. inval.)]|nr:hypothetical protein H8356DRAFT_515721 [Neocallimastix sp. JGI-2020a]